MTAEVEEVYVELSAGLNADVIADAEEDKFNLAVTVPVGVGLPTTAGICNGDVESKLTA